MTNVMTDLWVVFGRDQGQIVERAYRYDAETDRIIRRTTDRSDGRVSYSAAACPAGCEWNGSEGVAPWSHKLRWEATSNPDAPDLCR